MAPEDRPTPTVGRVCCALTLIDPFPMVIPGRQGRIEHLVQGEGFLHVGIASRIPCTCMYNSNKYRVEQRVGHV